MWCASFWHFDERNIRTSHRTMVVVCTKGYVCRNKTTCQAQEVQSATRMSIEYHTAVRLVLLSLSLGTDSVQNRQYVVQFSVQQYVRGCRIVCYTLRTSQFSIFYFRFLKNLKVRTLFERLTVVAAAAVPVLAYTSYVASATHAHNTQ